MVGASSSELELSWATGLGTGFLAAVGVTLAGLAAASESDESSEEEAAEGRTQISDGNYDSGIASRKITYAVHWMEEINSSAASNDKC